MTPESLYRQRKKQIVWAMQSGGYWQKVMESGPELDRVKVFLRMMAGLEEAAPALPQQAPAFFPIFPGLSNRPFHDPSRYPWVTTLESAFGEVRNEILAWRRLSPLLEYEPNIKKTGRWQAGPFYYMGVRAEPFCAACPKTVRLLESLTGDSLLYPWSDALLSVHGPGTHLVPHCSVDNLRLRCHFGISIPPGCSLRVGSVEAKWQEGKALLFEDSFEHEVWNRGSEDRMVLIVDFWHPDITASERRALLAGFRKSEVRGQMYDLRLGGAEAFAGYLLSTFEQEDETSLIREFWLPPKI